MLVPPLWRLHVSLHLDSLPSHFNNILLLINVLCEGDTVLLRLCGHFQHLKFCFISFLKKWFFPNQVQMWGLSGPTVFRTQEAVLGMAPKMVLLFLSSWFHQVWMVQQEQIQKQEVPWQEALHFWLPMLRKGALTWKHVPEKACRCVRGLVRYVLKTTLSTACLAGKTKAERKRFVQKKIKSHQTD